MTFNPQIHKDGKTVEAVTLPYLKCSFCEESVPALELPKHIRDKHTNNLAPGTKQ